MGTVFRTCLDCGHSHDGPCEFVGWYLADDDRSVLDPARRAYLTGEPAHVPSYVIPDVDPQQAARGE